jgi:hypothetical protein
MNLAFFGIVVNAAGSVVLVFTPLVAAYGGPIKPAHISWWRVGWGCCSLVSCFRQSQLIIASRRRRTFERRVY